MRESSPVRPNSWKIWCVCVGIEVGGEGVELCNLLLQGISVCVLQGGCQALPGAAVSKDIRVCHDDVVLEVLEEKLLVDWLRS